MTKKKCLDSLVADCLFAITEAYVNRGVPSMFDCTQKIIPLPEHLQFSAMYGKEDNRYYVEIGAVLYDNEGYSYNVSTLGVTQLVSVADYVENFKKPKVK